MLIRGINRNTDSHKHCLHVFFLILYVYASILSHLLTNTTIAICPIRACILKINPHSASSPNIGFSHVKCVHVSVKFGNVRKCPNNIASDFFSNYQCSAGVNFVWPLPIVDMHVSPM